MATNRNHDYVRHLQRTMRCSLFLLLCAACAQSVASPDAVTPRVLIHGFQATGPAEITGTVPANRVLRTMTSTSGLDPTRLMKVKSLTGS